jgi:DNA polymerase III alpha subunit (gram-positive type)
MQSPFKRILVYDLETGGFDEKNNQITEFAGVAIDNETLEIVEEFSVMLRPRLHLEGIEDEGIKEAKRLYKSLATPDPETNVKSLLYKGSQLTLKSLNGIAEELEDFNTNFLKINGTVIDYEKLLELEDSDFKDIAKLYFDFTYNPQALEATHISRDLLVKEGIPHVEAYKQINELIKRHTVGNSRPIIAGHNIKKFDNPFLVRLFERNKSDFFKSINEFQIDTLEWARIKWFELPNYSLGTCANEVGLTLKEAHRALPDTVANAKFLIKLLESLRGDGSSAESTYVRKKYKFNF